MIKHSINTRLALLLASSLFANFAFAHGPASGSNNFRLPAAIAVAGELGSPPQGVTDIKFNEFFKLPIGPRGLEPSEKLLALNGKKVRLVGYMVNSEAQQRGMFILSPLPVSIGDEDESLSDDLPASVVFVHLESPIHSVAQSKLPAKSPAPITFVPGLIKLTGTLQVGSQEEGDGRVSAVRLQADSATSKAIQKIRPQHQARN